MDVRALCSAIGVAVAVTFSAPAFAQSSGTQLERRCDDFGWLLGTWTSYSPWGDHTDPTGGTLVFTLSADGGVEGRLTSLNQYTEEYGYQPGMIVFRGFREVFHYGPDGTTQHESRDGEMFVIDVTATYDPEQQRGYWDPSVIGIRPESGFLYLNPTGKSHLSGHGEWRKKSGQTQSNAPDPCAPPQVQQQVSSQEQQQDQEDAQPLQNGIEYPDWRTLLERTKVDPPALFSPLAPPTDECLQIVDGREERPSNWLTRHRTTQDQLTQLSGYGELLSQPDLDPASRASHARSYLRVLKDVLDDYHSLHAARLVEQDAGRRQMYSDKIGAIEEQVQISDETRRFLQGWVAGKPLPDDVFEQIGGVVLNPASDSSLPEDQMQPLTQEEIDQHYQCMIPPLVVADPLVPSGGELDVHSVRNEQPPGLYPQRQDVDTLTEEARGAANAVREMAPEDPIRPALERLYSHYHRKLRIQQVGFAHLALDQTATSADRDRYAQQARDIGRALEALPEPASPPRASFGGFNVFDTVTPGPEDDPALVERFGPSNLQDLMRRIGNGNATEASADALLGSAQMGELAEWFRDNSGYVDKVEYDEDEGYLKVTPNDIGIADFGGSQIN